MKFSCCSVQVLAVFQYPLHATDAAALAAAAAAADARIDAHIAADARTASAVPCTAAAACVVIVASGPHACACMHIVCFRCCMRLFLQRVLGACCVAFMATFWFFYSLCLQLLSLIYNLCEVVVVAVASSASVLLVRGWGLLWGVCTAAAHLLER